MFGQTDIEIGFIKSTRTNVSKVTISISLCPNYSVMSIYVMLMVSMSVFYAIVYFSIIQSPQNSRSGWVQTHTSYFLDTGPKFIGLVSSNAGESFSVIYRKTSNIIAPHISTQEVSISAKNDDEHT